MTDIKELEQRVGELENQVQTESKLQEYLASLDVSNSMGRRAFLMGLASAGVISLSRPVVAQQTDEPGAACSWLGDQNAAGYGLYGLGLLEGTITNGEAVTTLNGNGLQIVDGTLEAEIIDSGSIQLSTGTATIDTGISESETATFYVALGPDTDDAEIDWSIQANSGGNYIIHLDEINTSVGNPTVNYDVMRIR